MKVSDFIWCGTIPNQVVFDHASQVQLLLMDVDGVVTDGRIYYLPGETDLAFETKGFASHDGLAFHFLKAMGIKTGFISGRESQAVEEYAGNKDITFVYQGKLDKMPILQDVLGTTSLAAGQVAYIGDDFTDVPVFNRVGLACAVADARAEVREKAHFVTQAKGGQGAVREVVELILKARGDWEKILSQYELSG
jgi:3-deoxy-D-manno-octulosonate 8-phosphate phosphatase (KDO 8-P phosphatase)